MKKKDVLLFLVGCVLYLAHFLPFIIAANTGIPYGEVVIAPEEVVKASFSDTDMLLAVLYLFVPAVGFFIVGLAKSWLSILGLVIGAVMLGVSMVLFNIHTNSGELLAYAALNTIALLLPVAIKIIELVMRKHNKTMTLKHKLLCAVATVVVGFGWSYILSLILGIVALILALLFVAFMIVAFGVALALAAAGAEIDKQVYPEKTVTLDDGTVIKSDNRYDSMNTRYTSDRGEKCEETYYGSGKFIKK